MKTAVSVPNDVFERIERLAHAQGRSRSEIYSTALREYIARHAPDEITVSIDRLMAELGDDARSDVFVRRASRRIIDTAEW